MQQPPDQENPQTDVLDTIPFEEQRIIDELVELWQTHDESCDLLAHIRNTLKTGYSVTFFFAQVRNDLRTDKHSKYAASSASEFRQILEDEYRRVYQPYAVSLARAKAFDEAQAKARAERHAQIKAEIERIKAEKEMRVRAEFDAIGKEMAKTTDRKERLELGRRREVLAPFTGRTFVYQNHCWQCRGRISSAIHAECPNCTYYICSSCGNCLCGYPGYSGYHDGINDPFLPDYPDDLS